MRRFTFILALGLASITAPSMAAFEVSQLDCTSAVAPYDDTASAVAAVSVDVQLSEFSAGSAGTASSDSSAGDVMHSYRSNATHLAIAGGGSIVTLDPSAVEHWRN